MPELRSAVQGERAWCILKRPLCHALLAQCDLNIGTTGYQLLHCMQMYVVWRKSAGIQTSLWLDCCIVYKTRVF